MSCPAIRFGNTLLLFETEELRFDFKNNLDEIKYDIFEYNKTLKEEYKMCDIKYISVRHPDKKQYKLLLQKEAKVTAILVYKDGTHKQIKVKVKEKNWDKTYKCKLYIKQNINNQKVEIYKDSILYYNKYIPDKCEVEGCVCSAMDLTFNI